MAETPDFEQIARRMSDYLVDENDIAFVAEQLRQVWNARGAADIATVETEAGGTVWPAVLSRALRKLDR